MEVCVMQGQGKYTANKIAVFEAFFTQNMAVVSRAIGAQSYFHFDLNAGCGMNEIAGCIGSPLAFRAAAIKVKMQRALCFCCELDAGAAISLQRRTEHDDDTFVTIGRNQDFVEMIPEIIRQHGHDPSTAFGSILIDPNNQRRDAIPYDGLARIAAECPKIDVLFHFPQNAMKRIRGAVTAGTLSESSASDCVDIDALPEIIGKTHCWIRHKGLGEFVMVVGRNTDNIKKDAGTGLHIWDSEDGLWSRERCQMRAEEADFRHEKRLENASGQGRLF
jgi:hypothetical protein